MTSIIFIWLSHTHPACGLGYGGEEWGGGVTPRGPRRVRPFPPTLVGATATHNSRSPPKSHLLSAPVFLGGQSLTTPLVSLLRLCESFLVHASFH